MVGLIVASFDRVVLHRQLVAVDSDQSPHLARPSLPQPRLFAEESVLALDEVLGLALQRLVPRPAAVGRAMQKTGRIAPLVANVLSGQVAGDEDGPILEHGQIGLAAEQIERLWFRPSSAAVRRAKQQRLLHDLVAVTLVLMKRSQQQFAAGQLRDTRLVVVRRAERNPLAGDIVGLQRPALHDGDVVTRQAKTPIPFALVVLRLKVSLGFLRVCEVFGQRLRLDQRSCGCFRVGRALHFFIAHRFTNFARRWLPWACGDSSSEYNSRASSYLPRASYVRARL